MRKTNSIASLKREQQRNSPATMEFRMRLDKFLETAKPEIAYSIKRDLACMTNMPYYKARPRVIKFKMSPTDLVCEYMELFRSATDKEFVVELIRKLIVNQNQTLRKAAPRIGTKAEVWEHAIPTKVIVEELIKMIQTNDVTHLRRLLDIYRQAGQRGLTKVQNQLLDRYRATMPTNWDWRHENVDPLARHKEVGIHHH